MQRRGETTESRCEELRRAVNGRADGRGTLLMTDELLKKIIVTLVAVTVFLIWHFHVPQVEE